MHTQTRPDTTVTVGVDTHTDRHVAVALDQIGRLLGTHAVPSTDAGAAVLLAWARRFGAVERVGIEVDRPKREQRRRRGKSDPIDAEAAARAVLAGTATAQPKAGTGPVEMIRALQAARRSAVKARTQAANQLHALVVTAPDGLRTRLRRLSLVRLVATGAAFRPGALTTPAGATKLALKSIAVRYRHLDAEVAALDAHLGRLLAEAAPDLLAVKGVGTDTAATLLVTAGDNPERLRTEAAFACLCGVAPQPASSGRTVRHRLSRGGDRQANRALHLLAVRRMGWDPATRAYVQRRTAEGLSTPEILRCLKRYIARELYPLLVRQPVSPPSTLDRCGSRSEPAHSSPRGSSRHPQGRSGAEDPAAAGLTAAGDGVPASSADPTRRTRPLDNL
jgi:transposase